MNLFFVKIIPYSKAKTIPYFGLKQLENQTLKCSTYPNSLYIAVSSSSPKVGGKLIHSEECFTQLVGGEGENFVRFYGNFLSVLY